jgi:hypothetical protein
MKILWLSIILLALLLIVIGYRFYSREDKTMEYEITEIIVDEEKISNSTPYDIIQPLWWSVSIYDGEKQYLEDLKKFSEPQRYVFTIEWYLAEVNNGGHDQFYYNSTGIVWEDALKGFEVLGLEENYEILKESANRLGGYPSKDREERQDQLDKHEPEFDDLDDRLYQSEGNIEEALLRYIKDHKESFMFKGSVKIPK